MAHDNVLSLESIACPVPESIVRPPIDGKTRPPLEGVVRPSPDIPAQPSLETVVRPSPEAPAHSANSHSAPEAASQPPLEGIVTRPAMKDTAGPSSEEAATPPPDGTTKSSREPASRPAILEDHRIGTILVDSGKLRPAEVEQIVELHHRSGLHFGEAAQRLGLLTEADVQAALGRQFGLPQLIPGDTGPSPELITAFQPRHRCTEEMRSLRTQLLLRWLDPVAGRRVLAITSPGRGDGRSYVAANLAVVFSQLGLRTLLIDADLRHPRQHRIFNMPDRVGLAAILARRADASAVAAVPGFAKLWLLPAGAPPPNPQELLSRPVFDDLLEELEPRFDLILLDTSAALVVSDSRSVAFRAGNALVLTRKHQTRITATEQVIRDLNDAGTRIVGTVINSF